MHQFSAASIIMYVASLSDYNQLCPEVILHSFKPITVDGSQVIAVPTQDGKTTRLLEALRVFQEVCSSPALSNVGYVCKQVWSLR